MTSNDSPLADLNTAHRQFLALVRELRPELHRYCARMTGSVIEAEDVVQDTLTTAYYELSLLRELPALRTWLFRIAHHRAIDHLRRRERRSTERLENHEENEPTESPDAELDRAETIRIAISRFVALAPTQRSCVVLKDVLDHSLEEIASMLDMTIPAVKAALHRGRVRLRDLPREAVASLPHAFSADIERYTALFQARDWDGVRAMLVGDVKLDLVSHARRFGVPEVGEYFSNYDRLGGWSMKPLWLEGRELVAVWRDAHDPRPSYIIELSFAQGRVVSIRDFLFAPYMLSEAFLETPQR